jgi:hypothetical protein
MQRTTSNSSGEQLPSINTLLPDIDTSAQKHHQPWRNEMYPHLPLPNGIHSYQPPLEARPALACDRGDVSTARNISLSTPLPESDVYAATTMSHGIMATGPVTDMHRSTCIPPSRCAPVLPTSTAAAPESSNSVLPLYTPSGSYMLDDSSGSNNALHRHVSTDINVMHRNTNDSWMKSRFNSQLDQTDPGTDCHAMLLNEQSTSHSFSGPQHTPPCRCCDSDTSTSTCFTSSGHAGTPYMTNFHQQRMLMILP